MSHRVLLKFSLTHCSQSDFNTIIRAISKRLGKHWFPENIHTAASEYANAMGTQFQTKVVEFQDNHNHFQSKEGGNMNIVNVTEYDLFFYFKEKKIEM